jgi:hypothetical protein
MQQIRIMKAESQKPAIRVSESTKKRLEAIGRMGDTYEDVIIRLLDEREIDSAKKDPEIGKSGIQNPQIATPEPILA